MALETLPIGEGQASSSVICREQVGLWFPIFRWMGEGQKLVLEEILFSKPEDSQITMNSRSPSSQSWCWRCCDGTWRHTMHGGWRGGGGGGSVKLGMVMRWCWVPFNQVVWFILWQKESEIFLFQNCFCRSPSLSLGKHPQLIFAWKI